MVLQHNGQGNDALPTKRGKKGSWNPTNKWYPKGSFASNSVLSKSTPCSSTQYQPETHPVVEKNSQKAPLERERRAGQPSPFPPRNKGLIGPYQFDKAFLYFLGVRYGGAGWLAVSENRGAACVHHTLINAAAIHDG